MFPRCTNTISNNYYQLESCTTTLGRAHFLAASEHQNSFDIYVVWEAQPMRLLAHISMAMLL